MTREDAIHFAECLKHNHTINFADMEVFCDMAIKALEQESVLDKIRAEIDTARFVDKDTRLCENANASGLKAALEIIDKYRTESEV